MKRALLAILTLLPAGWARGDVQLFVNDYAGFVQSAGPLSVIEFETRPDGLPWNGTEIINDTFNYDAHGVHFSAPLGNLIIGGNESSGFDLRVSVPSNQHTWITADLIIPAYAVGAHFGGHTTLCVFDEGLASIGCVENDTGGAGLFVGIVSDVPIARAVFDRGGPGESIQDFLLTPIPEPSAALLLIAGAGWLSRARRRLGPVEPPQRRLQC